MKISDRFKAPVSPFFKKVRTTGLVLTAAAGVLLAPPSVLPEIFVSAGGYLLVAGTVLVAVSQATVNEAKAKKPAEK